jgi:hypothetical protein
MQYGRLGMLKASFNTKKTQNHLPSIFLEHFQRISRTARFLNLPSLALQSHQKRHTPFHRQTLNPKTHDRNLQPKAAS